MKAKNVFTSWPGKLPRLIRSLLVSALIVLIALSGVVPAPASAVTPPFTATETVSLQTDANQDGIANPGDTLRYTFTLAYTETLNTLEAQDLRSVLLEDEVDLNTTLILSSLRSTVIARDDSFTTRVGTPLTIPIADLMFNDKDPDGGSLYLCEYGATTIYNGPITRSGDLLTYTPPPNFSGDDVFTYGVCDNTNFGDGAMVVIHVQPAQASQPSPVAQLGVLAAQAVDRFASWVPALGPQSASASNEVLSLPLGAFNAGHTFNGSPYQINLAGQSVTLSFDVMIDANIPAGRTSICNQGDVGSEAFVNLLTDDPALPGTADPTCIPISVPVPGQDADPPLVTITAVPGIPNGSNGWYKSAVSLDVQAVDTESGVLAIRCALDPQTPPASFDDLPEGSCAFLGGAQVKTDGAHTLYAAAVDNAANKSTPVSFNFKIDATAPVITCPAAGPFLLNSGDHSVTAGVAATVSGLDEAASTLSGIVPSSPVGSKALTFTAYDLAGNRTDNICSYSIVFNFGGFYSPVKPGFNPAAANSVIPIKFSLDGDQGLNIFASGFPKVQKVDCNTLKPTGLATATAPAGKSGLSYDRLTGWYNYSWKTGKEKAGTCQMVTIQLIDGTQHLAFFKFR